MSIEDALRRLEDLTAVPTFHDALTAKGTFSERDGAWLLLNAALKVGGVEGFIQAEPGQPYCKIPSAYWERFSTIGGQQDVFREMPDGVGYDERHLGRPIVIWESGLGDLIELISHLGLIMKDGLSADDDQDDPAMNGPFDRSSTWGEIC